MENQTTENKKDHVSILIKVVRVFLVVLLILVLMLGGTIMYFESHLFNLSPVPYSLDTFVSEVAEGKHMTVTGSNMVIEVPKDVINTHVLMTLNEKGVKEPYEIQAMDLNGQGQLMVNGSYRGIEFAFVTSLVPSIEEGQLKLSLGRSRLTKDQQFTWFIDHQNKIGEEVLSQVFPVYYDLSELTDDGLIVLDSFDYVNSQYLLKTQVNQDLVKQILSGMYKTAYTELIEIYKNSQDKKSVESIHLLEQSDQLSEADFEQLILNYFTDKSLYKGMVAVADFDYIVNVYQDYNRYFAGIGLETIMENQGTVLSESLHTYYDKVVDAIETVYFDQEVMYVNASKPYGYKTGVLDIVRINYEQKLEIPESIVEKLQLVVYPNDRSFHIAYEMDDDTVLLINASDSIMMRKESFEQEFNDYGHGQVKYVSDSYLWEQVVNHAKAYFQDESIFVRYMKTDERYVFAIMSPSQSFQNYWVFAYEWQEGELTLLMDNIGDVMNLNQQHPGFNMSLVLPDYQGVILYNLNDSKQETILLDMNNKGVLDGGSDRSIVYCSKSDNYIALRLDNGQEFIYYVYGTHLHTVHTKSYALTVWNDVPELIVLQNTPK